MYPNLKIKFSDLIYLPVSIVLAFLLLRIGLDYDWLLYKEYIILAKKVDWLSFLEITYRTEYSYDTLMWCYARLGMPANGFLILNGSMSYFLLLKSLHRILNISSMIGTLLLAIIVVVDIPMFILNANILRQQLAMSILLYFFSHGAYLKGSLSTLFHKSTLLLLISGNRRVLIGCISVLLLFRERVHELLSPISHDLYEVPSRIFMIMLIASTVLLRKKDVLFNYALLVVFFGLYTWNLTQFSSRFVLYGHPILIAGTYFVLMKLLTTLLNNNVNS